MTEIATTYQQSAAAVSARRRKTLRRAGLQAFLIIMSLIWLVPLAFALYTSLRPYEDTAGDPRGYVSIGGAYNFQNYINSWTKGELPKYFLNTAIILIPAVVLVLLLASMMAFTVSRYSWRLNLTLLMVFTAANLLPPGHHHAALPDLPAPAPAPGPRQRPLLRPVLRDHGDPCRLPAGGFAPSCSATT